MYPIFLNPTEFCGVGIKDYGPVNLAYLQDSRHLLTGAISKLICPHLEISALGLQVITKLMNTEVVALSSSTKTAHRGSCRHFHKPISVISNKILNLWNVSKDSSLPLCLHVTSGAARSNASFCSRSAYGSGTVCGSWEARAVLDGALFERATQLLLAGFVDASKSIRDGKL